MASFESVRRGLTHELRTLRGVLYRRLAGDEGRDHDVTTAFHKAYFNARDYNLTWRNTYWMGHPVLKCPLDLWLYQELVHRVRPSVIVETGTAYGGSALFLASVCDMIDHGRVVTVDLTPQENRPEHRRITYVSGSSTDEGVFKRVVDDIGTAAPVMVFLDSDHAQSHVQKELDLYHRLVTPDSYLVVEDTNLNGHPVVPEHGPGPWEAVHQFVVAHPEFAHDREMDKFLLSFNPRGYLRRRGR